ncbi:MAG: TonB-dependent receptor, partial [Nitrospinota bacterium]
TAGAEYRREGAEDKGNLNKNINNKAIYLNGKVKLFHDSLIFNAGMRYDDHEVAGSKTTYRTGILYNLIPDDFRFRANYATGFRAPSLNELYYPFFGNPNLRPEKSESYDLGIEKDFFDEKLQFSATYFTQEYTDLIEYDFATFTAMNIGKADIKGFDIDITIKPLENIKFKSAYTNLYAIERDTYKQLTRRPKDKVNVSIEYELQKLKLLGEYLYVSERFDSAVNRNLSQYSLVNIRGSYGIHKNFSIFARVDNLFNENYEEAGGYGTAGVSAFGGIRAEF